MRLHRVVADAAETVHAPGEGLDGLVSRLVPDVTGLTARGELGSTHRVADTGHDRLRTGQVS